MYIYIKVNAYKMRPKIILDNDISLYSSCTRTGHHTCKVLSACEEQGKLQQFLQT